MLMSITPFRFICSEQTQEQGVTVIYDMTDAKYSNFGADLSMKLLNLLTVSAYVFFFFFFTRLTSIRPFASTT